MLRKLQRSQCEGFPPELPGEAAAGKGLAAVAGPSPALCQPRAVQRNRGPNFPNSSTTAQLRISSINTQPASPASTRKQCEHPAALRSSAAGSARHQKPAVRQAGQLAFEAVPPRYGFAVVIPGRYSSRPCVIFALRAVLACVPHRCGPSSAKTPQSLPGVQDTAVPAVGADKVRVNRP